VKLIESETISNNAGKELLPELLTNGGSPAQMVEAKGLAQISDAGAIAAIIDEVMAANPKELEQYRNGKTKLLGFFVGQVLKKTGGRANPKLTNQLLAQKLNG
jgi:aspartyl-tRNA(Asn)/glutamyl-tRNA(Gln) amidotransferase subunit B